MRWLVPGISCAVWLWCCLAAAQDRGAAGLPDPGGTSGPTLSESSSGPVRESKLPVYLKADENGKPQLMIGWTLDDFEQLLQENLGFKPRDAMPPVSLLSISAAGKAEGTYADLTVEFTVLFRQPGPVRVPLGLDRTELLQGGLQYDGPGEPFLHFEEDGGGYVCGLEGLPGKQHRLTLHVLAPLSQVGDETRLALALPEAASSTLKLEVPTASAVGKVSDEALLLTATPAGDSATLFEVLGASGSFEITWATAGGPVRTAAPVLEVIGSIEATIDGRTVRSKATLRVRGHGHPIGSFDVRLPAGSELVAGEAADYTAVLKAPEAGQSDDRPLVRIQPLADEVEALEVSLATTRPLEASGSAEWIELAGFEVPDAARQWGDFSVAVVGQWQVFLSPNRLVRQVDGVAEPSRAEAVVGAFEYFSQPFSLTARVAPRKTRVSVEPVYQLLVDEDRVRLEATLRYTVRGAQVSAVQLELPGWQYDDVEPYELVPVGGVAEDPSGRLSIAFSQPMIDEFEITVLAHQEIAPGSSPLSVEFPRPQADSLRAATIVVLPAENVELTPDTEGMRGLIRRQAGPPMRLSEPRQAPMFYRGEQADARFVAEMTVHEQSVRVEVSGDVNLLAGSGRVDQKFAYRIDYKRLEELSVDLPASLADSAALEFFLDGQRLSAADMPTRSDVPGAAGGVRQWIVLPEPRLGPCELVVRHPIELTPLEPGTGARQTVPLAMPAGAELSSNTLRATVGPNVTIDRVEEPWIELPHDGGPQQPRSTLQLSAAGPAAELSLSLLREDRDTRGSTVVRRAWVQTWMDRNVRQDRAVFSFTSDEKSVTLIVPAGVNLDDVELRLDRQEVDMETSDHTLSIPLLGEANRRTHVLEVGYPFLGSRSPQGLLSMELPRLGGDVRVRRSYWQLVLPRNEHVVAAPDGLTAEHRWGWNGAFWGRIPVWEQPDLEVWSGAPPVSPAPVPAATSRYLFGSLGPIARCKLRTADRSLIVLEASAVALVAGLLLIYLPATRHPVTLLAAAVTLTSAAAVYPEPTLLVLQAASLGLALALMAGLLQRSLARRRRGILLGETSSSILDKGSTQTLHPAAPSGSQETTTAAPPAVPNSTPDTNS